MRILIVRTMPNKLDMKAYNCQELGLAKALVRKGHICDIFCYGGGYKDQIETIAVGDYGKINIIWASGIGILSEGFYPSLIKYINRYDLLQVSEYIGITSCLLNLIYGYKVVNYHGPYYHKMNKKDIIKARFFDKLLLPLSNPKKMIVIAKSKLAEGYIKDKGICNVTTVGVGLDIESLESYIEKPVNNDLSRFILESKKSNSKIMLYIGKMESRRNIILILQILKNLIHKGKKIKLIMIGDGEESYVKLCNQSIKELDLTNYVFWTKRMEQKELKNVYNVADLFILPTEYEIFGMVILEALYYGVPVITTYNGGSSTLIEDGTNGKIIDNYDDNIWSEEVMSILSDDINSDEIKEKIVVKYEWNNLADEFIKIYLERLENY